MLWRHHFPGGRVRPIWLCAGCDARYTAIAAARKTDDHHGPAPPGAHPDDADGEPPCRA